MSPRAILAIVTVVFIGVLGYGYITVSHQSATPSLNTDATASASQADTTNASTTNSTDSTSGAQTSGYTMAQVATHKDSSSCWTTISGKVYDLTQWINQHPGGPGPILSLCGIDGTKAFTAQHGGQGRPEAELKTLYIGELMQ